MVLQWNRVHESLARIFKSRNVVSASGNSNIIVKLQDIGAGDTLVVDGAAFGAIIENCLEYIETRNNHRISVRMPESFEFLILKSGLIGSDELTNILKVTSDYVECEKYESWERFFTELLILLTADKNID